MTQLFLNQNMESGSGSDPSNWERISNLGTCTLTWDTAQFHSGTHSLKIQGTGNAVDLWWWRQRIAAPAAGNKVRIGVWCKIQSGYADPTKDNYDNQTSLSLRVTPYDSSFGYFDRGYIWNATLGIRTQDWTYLPIADYAVQSGDAWIDVSIGLDARNDASTIVWFDDLESEIIPWTGVVRPTVLFRKDVTANIWSENQCASVLLTDAVPAGNVPGSPVHNIVAIKGERQAFQIVVQPLDADWSTVNITNSGFSGLSPTITVKRPRYVTIPAKQSWAYIRGGVVPDPMPVEADVTLTQNNTNPFMVEIDVPLNASPGTYTTNFYVMKGASTMATIPVSLEVKNVALPVVPTFWNIGNMENIDTQRIYYYEDPTNVKVRYEILNRYIDNYRANRMIPGGAAHGLEKFTSSWSSGVVLDTTEEANQVWAHIASVDMENWPPRGDFGTGGLGMGYTPKYTDANNTVYDSTFASRATAQIQAIMASRDAQGAGPFLWYFRDEPDVFDTPTINGMITESSFIKSVDNRIKICAATKPQMSLIGDYIDSMCAPDASALLWQTELSAMAAAGKKGGIYPNGWGPNQVGGQVAMQPETFRLLIWSHYFWGYRAILWWTIGDWLEFGNVEHNPWGTEGANGVYTGGDWFFGINFIYPPRNPATENGPIDTIRYSAMREGLEDIELFQMLQDLIDAGSGTAEQRTTAQAALTAANALATHPTMGINIYNDEFGVHDLGAIETARENVIDSILDLTPFYTRQASFSLPTDSANLTTIYTDSDVTKVATVDGIMVAQAAPSQYAIHEFKNDASGKSSCTVTWWGQTTLGNNTDYPTILEIYNTSTLAWVELDRNTDADPDTNFQLTFPILSGLDIYKDDSGFITCRVYQSSISR